MAGEEHGWGEVGRLLELGCTEVAMGALLQREIDWDNPPRFDGADYRHDRDAHRLAGQMLRVFEYMKSGDWHTLREIAAATDDPESSISAQLRHLRKPRFGGHTVEREHRGNGLYFYKLLVNQNKGANDAMASANLG